MGVYRGKKICRGREGKVPAMGDVSRRKSIYGQEKVVLFSGREKGLEVGACNCGGKEVPLRHRRLGHWP